MVKQSRVLKLLRWFFSPVIIPSDRKRQSAFLSTTLSLFIPLCILMTFAPIWMKPNQYFLNSPIVYITLGSTLIFTIAAILNHFEKYYLAAWLTVGVAVLVTFIAAIPNGNPNNIRLLPFLVLSLLFASILFDWGRTILIVVIVLIGVLVFPLVIPEVTYAMITNEYMFLLVTSFLIIVAVRHKEVIEMDRRRDMAASMVEQKKIEERLQNELQEKTILLREVNHRVMNNLQAIIGLAEMHMQQMPDLFARKKMTEIRDQASAIALVFDELSRSENLARVDMQRYVNNLAFSAMYSTGEDRGLRSHIDISPLLMDLDTAMPCGLIINELLACSMNCEPNCGSSTNEVWIGLHQEFDEYLLEYRDNNHNLVERSNMDGSLMNSLKLVELWATHQIDGKYTLKQAPDFEVEVRFRGNGRVEQK